VDDALVLTLTVRVEKSRDFDDFRPGLGGSTCSAAIYAFRRVDVHDDFLRLFLRKLNFFLAIAHGNIILEIIIIRTMVDIAIVAAIIAAAGTAVSMILSKLAFKKLKMTLGCCGGSSLDIDNYSQKVPPPNAT
jgi:hypothetical protein